MARPLLTLFLLASLTACTTTIAIPDERDDDPEEAAEYYALKHQGSEDPVASLAIARESMRAMKRIATNGDAERPFGKWTFLGPGNIGGRTRVLVIDSDDPQLMYSAGVSGGIWKSKSAGEHWEPVGDDLANIAINSLA